MDVVPLDAEQSRKQVDRFSDEFKASLLSPTSRSRAKKATEEVGGASVTAAVTAAAADASPPAHPHDWMESCRAVISGTDTLAGSVISMDVAVRLMRRFTGCSVIETILGATLHPAQVLGVDAHKGTLDVGADADFVILDETLHCVATYVRGELAWNDEAHFRE